MSDLETTVPKGSLVLVTGATGFVATHVCKQFLERGYKVRGTARDVQKASWLINDLFKTYAGRGDLELVQVPDLAADHAFDEAIKGVSVIVYVASIMTFKPDPHEVITPCVDGVKSILNAATMEPSVQRFVFTSSIVAAAIPMAGVDTHVERNTFCDDAVQAAWAPPPYDASRGVFVYMASKVAAEKAVWEFAEDKKPKFDISVVSPGSIVGEPFEKKHADSSANWLVQMYAGRKDDMLPVPRYVVDVKDVALVHVAAALDPHVKNARLQVWGVARNMTDILALLKKIYPDRKFIDELPSLPGLSITTDQSESLALLKKWAHQDGWRSIEDTVADGTSKLPEWGF
ncbi:hypothetical protein F5884DRAFT_681009 [Xylogone sp. PMI_703]|nr:hypothetical protein F5884DRAFT_681009 [Xylogone sp. PMI_703]